MWYEARAKQSVSSLEGDLITCHFFFSIMQREEGISSFCFSPKVYGRERRSTERTMEGFSFSLCLHVTFCVDFVTVFFFWFTSRCLLFL
jgi:hypothetical protein